MSDLINIPVIVSSLQKVINEYKTSGIINRRKRNDALINKTTGVINEIMRHSMNIGNSELRKTYEQYQYALDIANGEDPVTGKNNKLIALAESIISNANHLLDTLTDSEQSLVSQFQELWNMIPLATRSVINNSSKGVYVFMPIYSRIRLIFRENSEILSKNESFINALTTQQGSIREEIVMKAILKIMEQPRDPVGQ